MKSATQVIFEKADPNDSSARIIDPALARIVSRSRTRPAQSKASQSKANQSRANQSRANQSRANQSKINHAPVTSITEDDVDPLTELFRAAAAKAPPKSRALPAGIGRWVVAPGLATAIFLGGMFLGRNHVKAPSGLLLESTDAHGTLVIRWNYKAVQNLEHAALYIDDGGRFITVPLNHSRLVSGYFPYPRKFSLVTATMVAGDIQAVTSFVAHSPRRQVSHRDSATP